MAGPGFQKILGKIGNRSGAIVGIGTGVDQLIDAKQAKKKAIASTPGAVDPTQGAWLAELQQKKNALNTGSEYSSSLDAINDTMAQTQDVLAGNSGGDTAGTVNALLKSQQVANRGTGQILAQGQQSEGMWGGLYNDMLNKIAQRKMDLGLLGRAQNMAEWAQKSQTGMANLTAGAQSMMDFKGSDKPAQNPMIGSTAGTSGGGGVDNAGIMKTLGKFKINKGGDTTAVSGSTVAPEVAGGANGAAVLNGSAASMKGFGGGGGTPGAFSSASGGGGMDFSKAKDLLSSFGGK